MAKRQRYGVYPYINVLDVSVAGSATQQACLPLTMGRGFTSMENYFLKYQVTKTTICGTCNVHWMYWNKVGLRLSRGRGFIELYLDGVHDGVHVMHCIVSRGTRLYCQNTENLPARQRSRHTQGVPSEQSQLQDKHENNSATSLLPSSL